MLESSIAKYVLSTNLMAIQVKDGQKLRICFKTEIILYLRLFFFVASLIFAISFRHVQRVAAVRNVCCRQITAGDERKTERT